MQVQHPTLPGYRVNDYQLVLVPHQELWNRVQAVRQGFYDTYKAEGGRWDKPHLLLATFQQYEMMEERIIHRINMVAMEQYPFKIELRDFGSFPNHTIYINIPTKIPVQSLVKNIRREAGRLMKLNEEHKPHFISEPHLSIARKLKPWQYEKGWLEYSHRHFTGRFIADHLVMLRRLAGEKHYHVARRFEFQNLPVLTRQGELF